MSGKPTARQIEWAEQEVGVIFHYDITVFEQDYKFRKSWGFQPKASAFAPTELSTDQWIESAKLVGAKYAVLVAKHCTGFALFPSEANEYNVKNAGCNIDIVKEFVASCKKYGVKPGVYYSTGCNAYENVDANKVRSGGDTAQAEYNAKVKKQLEELWGNYGEWFEIWFDGGTLSLAEGGLDIAPIFSKYQPNAITFQGDRVHKENNLRWVGNELGVAPFDCYATIHGESQSDGVVKNKSLGSGDKDGERWSPCECDAPIRKHNNWFYLDGQDNCILGLDTLTDMYYRSVGRNCNLLLGVVVDRRGLVPESDRSALKALGAEVSKRFGKSVATTSGAANGLTINFKKPTTINNVVIKENITNGHTVFGYRIEVKTNGKWREVFNAKVIGHKRIARIKSVVAEAIRLTVTEGNKNAKIVEFSVFNNPYSFKEKIKFITKKFM